MNSIIEAINRAVGEAQERCAAAESQAGIEAVRIDYLGRNGLFPELSRQMGTIPAEERRETGAAFNTGRNQIQKAMDDAMARFADSAADGDEIDLTLPGRRMQVGRKHPISRLAEECVAIFRRMGFIAVDGPEIESIYHNFDALNTPMDHPSRDPQDTFYFPDGRILRSQTSPVQIRV
ncbi:MAG: phenylalanine--tRNA ligase subunit alpha, partial [Lentisphaeria bacterium]|nr:phenylalanine--tRNA ligase subunit alpha [Lentisphaeria bacterium]